MKLYRPKLNIRKPFYCISYQKNPPLLPTQPAQLCWATKLGKGGGFRWLELQSYNFEGSSFGYRCFIFEILSKIGDMLPTPTQCVIYFGKKSLYYFSYVYIVNPEEYYIVYIYLYFNIRFEKTNIEGLPKA